MRGYALEHGGRHERAVEEGDVCGGWRGHCAVLTEGYWQKSGDGADGAEVGAALVWDDVEECERMKCTAPARVSPQIILQYRGAISLSWPQP